MVGCAAVKRALLCLFAAACIERPPRDAGRSAPAVDRNALRDVLLPQVPQDAVPVGALFGAGIELAGYRVEPAALVPGQFARVTLYWRCRAAITEPWRIFVHLDDAGGGGGRINRDHDPAMGRFPTDAWRPGDIIADPFVFPAPRTPVLLFLGLFSEGENRLALASPGRGRDDGRQRLLAGLLPLAK